MMFDRTFSGVLGPHFAQLKIIGGGGSGSVYSGVDTRFGFPVCIKRLSVTNKEDCRTTLREIRIRRRLRHENIVGLLNAVTSEGTDVSEIAPANFRDTSCIYLVQELLDADLRQIIESNSRLPDDHVKLFFYQLLRGVKYIHSANVLHRDLKPSNVMINVNSLELMIGDFGHSIVLDPDYNHSSCHSSCDTSLWYKAPELIVGSSRYSTASDMWSVGCILAEMLLGRPLFEGENDLEQLELIIHTTEINEKDQLSVRQCLTKEVNKMYTGKPKFPLKSKFQKVDFHVLRLLENLLSFDAADRVSAELALRHPFLQEYSCVSDEPVCLKPLHLEHEVDDFLEYTLKDLIVGECVALAEEQPRIHMQMSSYSSLMDIVKELNNSPSETVIQSVEDGKNGITNENEEESRDGGRFKVLEVLKEEHTSSSDSNGIPSHDDGMSEEPLISDHHRFSSLKWENEHQKFGHRRHHSHHRKKSAADDGSRSRSRKISPGHRTHKSPNSEREIHSCSIPEGLAPGSLSPNLSSSNESRLSPGKLSLVESDSTLVSKLVGDEQSRDNEVKELISKSSQFIADRLLEKPALSPLTNDQLDNVNASETMEQPSSVLSLKHLSTEEDRHSRLGDPNGNVGHCGTLSISVANVIRRSRELLGEPSSTVYAVKRETLPAGSLDDPVKDLILKSELLLSSREKELGQKAGEKQEQIGRNMTVSDDTVRDGTEDDYTTHYTLQPILSDPFHLRESNRRMQELLEESHTLLSNLRNDPEVGTSPETGSLQPCEVSGRPSCELAPSQDFLKSSLREHNLRGVPETTDQKAFPTSQTKFPPPRMSNGHAHNNASRYTGRDVVDTLEDEVDLVETRAVLSKAKKLLDYQDDYSSNDSSQAQGLIVTELEEPIRIVIENTGEPEYNNLPCRDVSLLSGTASAMINDAELTDRTQSVDTFDTESTTLRCNSGNEGTKEETIIGKSEVTRMQMFEFVNPFSFCYVLEQDTTEGLPQQAGILEPFPVNYVVIPWHQILVKSSVLQNPICGGNHNVMTNRTNYSGSIDDGRYSCAVSGLTDIAAGQEIPGDVQDAEGSRKRSQGDTTDREGQSKTLDVAVTGVEERLLRNDNMKVEPTNWADDCEGRKVVQEELGETTVISPCSSPDNESINHVPNALAHGELQNRCWHCLEQTPINCDSKTPSIEDKEIEDRKYVNIGGHGNAWSNSLKHRHSLETANEADLTERTSKCSMDQKAYATSVGSFNNATESSITNKLSSEDFVGKIYRTEKNAKSSNGGLHSKDNAGLRNFYATIKIKSLMNRSRTYRDKLY